MLFSVRRVAPVVPVACLGLVAGCGASNNKGKIVGKWKITGGSGIKEEDVKMMEAFGVYAYMEFQEDGTLTAGAAAKDPAMNEKLAKSPEAKTLTCKYKLLSGDTVEIYNIPKEWQEKEGGGLFGKKDRGRGTVKIEGDNMTLTDDSNKNNPMKLTKVK